MTNDNPWLSALRQKGLVGVENTSFKSGDISALYQVQFNVFLFLAGDQERRKVI